MATASASASAPATRRTWLTSHMGRKLLTAATGLFLLTFLVVHLLGNLQLFAGDGGTAFNEYTYFMTHSPLIKAAEYILFAGFLGHIVLALAVNAKTRGARKSRYKVYKPAKQVPVASRFMVHTGIVFLVWLIIHLYSFWFHRITSDIEEREYWNVATPFGEVVEKFGNLGFVIFYVIAMLFMLTHLSHGVYSALQTVGLTINKKIDRVARAFAWVFAVVVSLAFAAIPIGVYVIHHT